MLGIASFRRYLRRYLRRVRAGERLVLTDRGEPIAEIIPYRARQPKDATAARIAYLAARGLVAMATCPLAKLSRPTRRLSGTPGADAVTRDRDTST